MGQAEGLAQGEQRGRGWGTRSDLARSASAYVHPLGPEVNSGSISPYREKEARGQGWRMEGWNGIFPGMFQLREDPSRSKDDRMGLHPRLGGANLNISHCGPAPTPLPLGASSGSPCSGPDADPCLAVSPPLPRSRSPAPSACSPRSPAAGPGRARTPAPGPRECLSPPWAGVVCCVGVWLGGEQRESVLPLLPQCRALGGGPGPARATLGRGGSRGLCRGD